MLHSEKKHGLSNDIDWQNVDCDLLLIPDAGTNDVYMSAALYERMDILVLDHHIIEEENPYATIVNCNDGSYPNTELCGTGVTWQFLRALDDFYWFEDADNYTQQVAIATIADIMDVTVPENRQLIDIGLSDISHPLFVALADKANTPLQSIIGIDIQFGIVPFMNALIRVGNMEEKELLFKALLCKEEYFNYQKRGSDEVTEESIYERVARLCYNAKSRQKRSNSNSIDSLLEQIESKGLNENKVLVVNGTKTVEQALTGMVAAQLADRFRKPCLVLRKRSDETYGGSGRNSTCSVVSNFKELLEKTGCFEYVNGHNSAFGVSISKHNITQMIAICNEIIPDNEATNYVDFIIDASELDFELVAKINRIIYPFVGEGFPEPLIAVRGIKICGEDIKIIGKSNNMYRVCTDKDVDIVNFKTNDKDPVIDLYEKYNKESELSINNSVIVDIVGTVRLNYFCGIITSQLVVKYIERSDVG